MDWDFSPPPLSELKDHDVAEMGTRLKNRRIALLITGSIAAYRTPDLIRELRREGADVVVFISEGGRRYVAEQTLQWCSLNSVITGFSAEAEHLSDTAPFDVYLIAPATYNTINAIALGTADNVITSTLASGLGKMERKQAVVLIAPAMHGSMHNSILNDSLKKLHTMGVHIIPPRQENGKNNLASNEKIVADTIRSVSGFDLQGKEILVTGGATPVYLDHIRCITNHFTGALAINIAKEAYFRGAKVHLLLGRGSQDAPEYLNTTVIRTYDDYVATIESILNTHSVGIGIFTAAVADYRPENVYSGKIPSGEPQTWKLIPTEKVIKRVRRKFPELFMAAFKYEENISHEKLMEIAQARLQEGYPIVVANRGEEKGPQGEQVAWLVEQDQSVRRMLGKLEIAQHLLNCLAKK
ncbi:MAG: bifunctional phosphopantothenoylcysteine decarboxylase/phosphopantothenate--cysteine ligase CoaBC [SAR324 cluster bacterium]|nr:bifunctional phosphopantothenoylcysteine decarboxylase/phosphopantothenate--cysteine ligase CoaBC [SAR324 cluster bacterium]